jgi:lipopolysaccharide biosynthesis protein
MNINDLKVLQDRVLIQIEKEHPRIKVFINENVGLDIGGTLYIIDYILKEKKNYDYLLKLHSKKGIHEGRLNNKHGEIWRDELINPILGDYEKVNKVIDIFTENPIVGMIGAKKYLYDKNFNIYQNSDMLKSYVDQFKLNVNLDELQYIGGTMFWVRFDIIKTFFTVNDPIRIIKSFEKNAFTDNNGLKWTHAFERIFGLMVAHENKNIIGL